MAGFEIHRKFNVTGTCIPGRHYMVDTSAKIERIVRDYIVPGEYFTINRARQYGKTTTLSLLDLRLKNQAIVIRLSFEGRDGYFESRERFAKALAADLREELSVQEARLAEFFDELGDEEPDQYLRRRISMLCGEAGKPVVLMVDEVDRATDYAVFASFLGLLRDMYLRRNEKGAPTFQSVVLAGVHDIKNLRRKIRPESEHSYNSPWNIAADFDMDMSFSAPEIATMLEAYEGDRRTGMDIGAVAGQLHYYTSGYPFLVSKLCKMIDETPLEWSPAGVDDAETKILLEQNTLFDDLTKNVLNNDAFRKLLEGILLRGAEMGFEPDNPVIGLGVMYGILQRGDGKVRISNILFETRVTNLLISLSETRELSERYAQDSVFVKNGVLDMDLVANRFEAFMKSEHRDEDGDFIEHHARLLFLGFLRPIINGTGHYAVEPQTRNNRRMDVVVFYGRKKYVIELKIWHGEQYESDGIDQLSDYLDSQEQKKGWLVSFCGNKNSPREGGTFEHKGFTIAETVIAYRDNRV
jgi:hypothetical protein